MSIIVENGTGVENANSYLTVAESDTYLLANYPDWDDVTTEDKEIALKVATYNIDRYVQFNGRKATAENSLEYPRLYASYNSTGETIPEATIPKILKRGTAHLAYLVHKELWVAPNPVTGVSPSTNPSYVSILDLTVSGAPMTTASVLPDMVKALLKDITLNSAGTSLKLVR